MRQVAEEEGLARFARDHFGPLVPAFGLAILEEEIEQLVCAVAPAKPYEGSDGAKLVGRVVLPFALAVAAFDKFFPVAFERVAEQRLRQPALLAAGRQRDGGGRGIEVAEFGGAGDEVDAVLSGRRVDRLVQVRSELIA